MSGVQASTADMRPLALAVLFLLVTGCAGDEQPAPPSPAERDVRLLARDPSIPAARIENDHQHVVVDRGAYPP